MQHAGLDRPLYLRNILYDKNFKITNLLLLLLLLLFHHTLNMSLHYLVKYECQKTGSNLKYAL